MKMLLYSIVIHVVRRGVRGVAGGGGQLVLTFDFYVFLLVSSVTYGDDDSTPTPLW